MIIVEELEASGLTVGALDAGAGDEAEQYSAISTASGTTGGRTCPTAVLPDSAIPVPVWSDQIRNVLAQKTNHRRVAAWACP